MDGASNSCTGSCFVSELPQRFERAMRKFASAITAADKHAGLPPRPNLVYLDTWLTTPPFIRDCPVCTRRIWHPAWPADHKQLEKAWQKAEAAKREQSEISDLMGF